MAVEIIKENEKNIMVRYTGMTKFQGCQCFKDCFCSEDFISAPYDCYVVKRKKKKTTNHNTLEEAEVRWNFVNTL